MSLIPMILAVLWGLNITGLASVSWLILAFSTIGYYIVKSTILLLIEVVKDKK